MPEERPPETQERTEGGASRDKHSRARRRLLKALAAAGGAAAATQMVPARWVKPVVDTVVVPAHAQATGPSMTVQLSIDVTRDDADEPDAIPPQETFNSSGAADAAFLGFDDLFVDGQATLVNPPVPGQSVTLTIAPAGGTDAVAAAPLVVPSIPGTGVAVFGDINVDQGDDTFTDAFDPDSPPADFQAGFTATFSSAGVPSQVITITFA